MWVEPLTDGKFKFVERYEDPLTGLEHKVSTTLSQNNRQARKTAVEILETKIKQKMSVCMQKSDECTLEELVTEYRQEQLLSVKKSTYSRNYHACNTLMNILGAKTLVSRFSARYIKQKFLKTGKGAGTLNEHLRRFKALIRWGYANDLVSDISYLDKLKPFKDVPHRIKIQDKYLETEELKAVIKSMDVEQWCLVTKFMALSGLRFAEFCALENKDVDLTSLKIHVRNGFDSVNRLVTNTKNEFSARDVHIQPELLRVCHDINAFMLRRKVLYGIKNCSLFMSETNGDHVHYYSFNKYFKYHVEQVTGKHITPHALRHTHASLLFEQGFTLDEIARRLGHGNSKVTREIYTHITSTLKEKDNAHLDQVRIL